MHIHNVADYAPTGHKLLRTEYADGGTRHVFADESGKELACVVHAADADAERKALEAFKAEHEPHEDEVLAEERARELRGDMSEPLPEGWDEDDEDEDERA